MTITYVAPEKRLRLKLDELQNVDAELHRKELQVKAWQQDIENLKSRKQHLEWETRDMKQRGVEL